jgi:glycerophosphoryl diester phosphodiesterase
MTRLPDAFRRVPLAHRGLHDMDDARPENSRASVCAAVAAGYGIEIDLQPSRDGRPMVFHDYDLGRLTPEHGPLRERDAAELAKIPLAGRNEGIPDLPEILELVAGRVPLLVELKDQHGQMGDTDGTLEHATARALDGYGGPVAVMSFNPSMVARMATLAPDVPRGIVTCDFSVAHWPQLLPETRTRLRGIPDYEACGAQFVSHQFQDLQTPRIAALHAGGAMILSWTVRSAADERVAREVADNITFEGYLPEIPA